MRCTVAAACWADAAGRRCWADAAGQTLLGSQRPKQTGADQATGRWFWVRRLTKLDNALPHGIPKPNF